MLQQGMKLNDTYILLEQLGSGGGGIVYKAYHERLQTYVVVKQIKDSVKGLLKSRAEADILKNLKHTRLPRVYDFLEIEGEVYTVMDFIPGMSLNRALVLEGRFSQKEVYQWTLQLADALSYLHSRTPPVIHSDIKPANIMLTPERDICLIDFNVSLAFDRRKRTSTSTSRGYSPPEQYRDFKTYKIFFQMQSEADTVTMKAAENTVAANSETVLMDPRMAKNSITETESLLAGMMGGGVDERSDVYSLGATVYHLLTGLPPSKDFEKITPVTDFDIKLSEGFGLIIRKMMALEPEKRYQNGEDLLYALEHIYQLDSEYKAYRRGRRNRKILLIALFLAGSAMMGTGWVLKEREIVTAYNRAVEQAGYLIKDALFDQAKDEINAAVKLNPAWVAAYEKEVLRLYSIGDYEEAVRYGRDVIKNPAYCIGNENDEKLLGNIYYVTGNAYFEMEEYGNAIPFFEEAIRLNHDNSRYFSDYAVTLAKTGNVESAEQALGLAVSLGLGQDSIYMVQAEIAFAQGEDEEAVRHLMDSLRITKDHDLRRRAVILCALAYQRLGGAWLDDEISLLEGAENTFGSEVSMHISEMLGNAYARKAKEIGEQNSGYYGKALEKFEKLYRQGYATCQMMENIAILNQQMDHFDQAYEILNQMIEKYPDDYRGYKRLAFLEADRQQKKTNEYRDYQGMKSWYEKAKERYRGEGDTEMQMLDTMIGELQKGGWF